MKPDLKTTFAIIGIFLLCLVAVTAPWIAPYPPNTAILEDAVSSPTAQHWFGTDKFGRDILSRVIYGSRVTVLVGVISQSIAVFIGIILGALAGYFRGWIDDLITWLINVVWAFPALLFVIAITLALGPGIFTVYTAVALVSWVGVARIVRGQFFLEREKLYVTAAKARGLTTARIIFKHILPNTLAPIIVVVSLGFAGAIVAEAGLSFLGLGIQPPDPSWGSMLRDGYTYFTSAWWMAFFPGIAITLTVLAFNILGDTLRDAIDPKKV